MNVAKRLKESTKKLCRQLQKKPDVEGNQTQVQRHKSKLIDTIERVIREINGDSLAYNEFRRMIEDETAESDKYEQQKEREKQLTMDIQKLTADNKKAVAEWTKEQEEDNLEINQLKKNVNETQVEKELHLQYLERQIEGEYAMYNRKYKQMESNLLKEINDLERQLKTEEQVSGAVTSHLVARRADLEKQYKERDNLRENKNAEMEAEVDRIMQDKQAATDEYQELKRLIEDDNEDRKRLEAEEKKNEDDEKAKVQEKIAMDDAARYVQRRWDWYQTEGRFLAKKGKKKGRGKGKKKKK